MLIVKCPNCQAPNRIPDISKPGTIYRCAKCKSELNDAPEVATPQDTTSDIITIDTTESEKDNLSPFQTILRKLPFIHPLLFAAFPVLALYAINADEVTPSQIVIPLLGTLGLTLLLLLSFLLLTALVAKMPMRKKKVRRPVVWDLRKAAVLSTLFLILFFSYGHVLIWIDGWDTAHRTFSETGEWVGLILVWIVLLVVGAFFVIKAQRSFDKTTSILNVIAGVLVIVAVINIFITESRATDYAIETADYEATSQFISEEMGPLPDVYYIILDRYGSNTTLKEVYGYDNSEFLNGLSDKGFYIASQSVSNYPFTDQSLISSLNINYIHEAAAVNPVKGNIRDYEVWRFLKSRGYEFIHFGSWYENTRENEFADVNVNYYSMPEFSWFLFQTTLAYPICVDLNIVDEWWEAQYKRVLYKFDELAKIPEIDGPTFVFAHMLVPHPPFVFARDGSLQIPSDYSAESLRAAYIDQMIATNGMLVDLVDAILAKSEVAPIIIIQADEGPRSDRFRLDPSGLEDLEHASIEELQEKMRILNVYYLPNIDQDVLYPSISPVNSFRLVFNLYFGTDFNLLPDRSYIGSSDGQFIDVTHKVKYH